MSRFVVDGMNVIGARPDGWWRDRDGAVRRLHAGLAGLAEAGDDTFVLVLDGHPLPDLPEHDAAVPVRYARRAGADAADDRIVELVGGDADPGAVTVVTADRGLRARLAVLGVTAVGPRTLWARLDAAGS